MSNKKIGYILSDKLIRASNRLPVIANRASVVQDLIASYNILINNNILVKESKEATLEDLKLFHSSAYLDVLQKIDLGDVNEKERDEYGLNYDCEEFEGILDYVKVIAGSSIAAADLLVKETCDVAINWFGGWHHAQRDYAEGFCYVNDVVLAIHKLEEKFRKILYIDLDIHHGNGVQNAFEFSNKILTLSLHKHSPGFYPGTGNLNDIGVGKGKYHSINIPFLEGVSDKSFIKVFNATYPKVFEAFQPNVLVVQCGADGLTGDRLGESNLTLNGPAKCVQEILKYNCPTLFLGGGGYNFSNTSRLWTFLTGLIIGTDLNENIPDSSDYFTEYGPSYELQIEESMMKDLNNDSYLENLIKTVHSYCAIIKEQNTHSKN